MAHRNLRIVTGVLVLVGGLIHLLDWFELLRNVPKIGPLFLLNVAVSVIVAGLLFVRRGWLGIVAAIALSVGTLAGFLLARYGTLFGYSEPTWRTTIVLAAVVEVAAAAAAVVTIMAKRRSDAAVA
ncbi:MAG TPA: hypothetical protein VGR26_12670 [Acidimicrobiales bacterium]|nr:hypothetical protein [Acidimicrobiales bacterium]